MTFSVSICEDASLASCYLTGKWHHHPSDSVQIFRAQFEEYCFTWGMFEGLFSCTIADSRLGLASYCTGIVGCLLYLTTQERPWKINA